MCDDVERCDVWREEEPVARRTHVCLACRETIRPGHRYRQVTQLYDGSWDRFKHCMRCAMMIDAIHEDARKRGEHGLVVDPELDCGEIWHNPPPEVEALAFMLPGEAA